MNSPSINFAWTDEAIATLERLWAEGLSASQIAKALNNPSRSSIIGKLHRLQAQARGRGEPSAPRAIRARVEKPQTPKATTQARNTGGARKVKAIRAAFIVIGGGTAVVEKPAGKAPRAEFKPDAWAPLPGVQPVPFLDRGPRQCRWPVGGEGVSMLVCAHHAEDGRYCAAHAKIAFQPMAKKTSAKELIRGLRRYVA